MYEIRETNKGWLVSWGPLDPEDAVRFAVKNLPAGTQGKPSAQQTEETQADQEASNQLAQTEINSSK